MAKKKTKKKTKVATIEGLAGAIADLGESIDERFDAVDERFDAVDERFDAVDEGFAALELELRGGFSEMRRLLERIDTRLSALELAVFGATSSEGGRIVAHSIFSRLSKLEKTVFHK